MTIIHRMKVLLALLQELGGELCDARMQAMLFLYCKEFVKRDEYYEFIPLAGQFISVQAQEDKSSLAHKNLLEKSNDWVLTPTNKRFAAELDFFEKIAIQDLKNKCAVMSGEALQAYIAGHYPASHIASDQIGLYTIGYEGLSPEAYINLLLAHDVKLLVDVRKNAFSQKFGFSKSQMAGILPRAGIEYMHMPELGIESDKRQNLNTDRDYETLFKEYDQTVLPKQQAALDRLEALLQEHKRIAITCFEANHHHCHRSRVARALSARESFTHKTEHLSLCNRTGQS